MRRSPLWLLFAVVLAAGVVVLIVLTRDRGRAQDGSARAPENQVEAELPGSSDAAAPGMTGRIVDPAGKPVSGARVACYPEECAYTAEYGEPIAEGVTAGDGRFTLAELGDGAEYVVLVQARGFADALLRWKPGWRAQTGGLAVGLKRAVPITGRVSDSAGAPLEGARITYYGEEYISSRPVTTDAHGVFSISYAPPHGVNLEARKEGFHSRSVYVAQAASKARGEAYELVLIRVPVVAGVVTDAASGEPIRGATVYCMQSPEPVQTDSEGRYRFEGLEAGERQFAAAAAGLATPTLVRATLKDDATTRLDLALKPVNPIKGVVADSRTRKAIAGARLMVGLRFSQEEMEEPSDRRLYIPGEEGPIKIPEGRSMMEAMRGFGDSPICTTTDDDGCFEIPFRFPEMIALLVMHDEYIEGTFGLEHVPDDRQLWVGLDEGGVIAGRVLRSDGEPAGDIQVVVGAGHLTREKRTDAEGQFRFGGLYLGRHTVAALDPARRGAASTNVAVGQLRVVDNVELVLIEHGSISGRLATEDGRGIEDVHVRCTRLEESAGRDTGPDDRVPDASFEITQILSEALGTPRSSDAEGRYSSGALPPGTYEVRPTLPDEPISIGDSSELRYVGAEPESRTVVVASGAEVADVSFTIRVERLELETATVSGTVLDLDGKPIAGAQVAASNEYGRAWEATTGDDGTFALTGVDLGEHRVSAHADGYLAETVSVSASADDVTIQLSPGGGIAALVVDAETGEPVEDYYVEFSGPPEACGYYHGPMPSQESDHPGGRFGVEGLEAGVYEFTIRHPNYAPATVSAIPVEEDGITRELRVELVEGTRVTLRITSALDGKPVSGARIGPHRYSDWHKTGMDGTAVLEHCAAEPHRLLVRRRGFADQWVTFAPNREEKTKTVEVRLDEGLTIRGCVVTGAKRHPVPGAFVIMTQDGWPKWDKPGEVDPDDRAARTDAEGRFSFDLVAHGPYVLTFQHERLARTMLVKTFDSPSTARFSVEMGPGGRVAGIVTAQGGRPAERVHVELEHEGAWESEEAETDEQGRYHFTRVVPGTYTLSFRDAAGRQCTRLVDVRHGLLTQCDVRFAGATLSGTVVLAGKPHAGQDVWVRSKQNSWWWDTVFRMSVKTDARGVYRIEGLPPGVYSWGTYVETGRHEGYGVSREVRIGSRDTVFNIALDAAREHTALHGSVRSENNVPLLGAWLWIERDVTGTEFLEAVVTALDPDGPRPSVMADGTFHCTGLDPGCYVVHANCRGHRPTMVAFDKPAGRDVTDLVVTLQKTSSAPYITVSGRVTTADGGDLRCLSASVLDAHGRRCREWREIIVRDGRYSISLPAGRYTFMADAPSYAPVVRELDLGGVEETTLDLTFAAGHTVDVQVTDAARQPVSGALVVLDPGGDPWLAGMLSFPIADPELGMRRLRGTGPDGTVQIEHVPDGQYVLRVRARGYQDGALPGTIAGKSETATVVLQRQGN